MSKVTTTFEAVDSGMVATIQKIERETKSMGIATEKAEKSVSLSFGAMAKAGAGLALGIGVVKGAFAAVTGTIDKFGQALDMGGRLADLSSRTGETAGNLLLLERAFDNSGVGADKVGTAINKLQKFMVGAKDGTDANVKAMSELGISYDMIKGMTPTQQMEVFAEKISAITSPAERAATAMAIFGKSGGELLPLLMNFSSEIGNAKSELGSMVGIMDAKAAVFDTIGDKFEIIKGKSIEFAAGILSKVTPALELITTVISQIDAAGLGERLANSFIGAGSAMDGFNAALKAFKAGEFELAWTIAIKSIYLQAIESINEINSHIQAAFAGAKGFLIEMFSPGSPLVLLITDTFTLIGNGITIMMINAIGAILGEIPAIGTGLKSSMRDAVREIEKDSADLKLYIQEDIDELGGSMQKAGAAWSKGVEGSYAKTKPLIDTTVTKTELIALNIKASASEAERLASAFRMVDLSLPDKLNAELKDKYNFKPMGVGKPEGFQLIEQSMKGSKPGDDIKQFGKADAIKQLSEIEKLKKELEDARTGRGTKEQEKQAKDLIGSSKFKQAERAIQKIQEKEIQDQIRVSDKGEIDRRSIADIAKEEGIKTFGKSKKQLEKEILEKRGGKLPAGADKKKGDDKKGAEKEAVKPKEDQLLDLVKMIKEIVGKIEPKLPTHALAL